MLYKLSKVPATHWDLASKAHALQNGRTSNGAEYRPKFGSLLPDRSLQPDLSAVFSHRRS